MKQICVVTGTRAEYGLLKPLMKRILHSEDLKLQLIVTGSHLSSEFGFTYQEIEKDEFTIDKKIDMQLNSDSDLGILKSMSIGLIEFGESFQKQKPDLVILLGDRYEILMVAIAAMMIKIPIAHIHGGELTEGAYDDAIRHSITKMSQLHFTSTKEYRRRVIQLGEQPNRVFCVGALGIENIKNIPLWTKKELEKDLEFSFSKNTVLVTFHPVTMEGEKSKQGLENLLEVLNEMKDFSIILTGANADTGNQKINERLQEFARRNKQRCIFRMSLGQMRYLSALQYCSMVIGNSSSGVIEVPSFHIPTINIGNRQKGRITSESVIHCGYGKNEIKEAIHKAMKEEFRKRIKFIQNPYEGEKTSEKIIEIIRQKLNEGVECKKQFFDIS